MGLFIKIHRRKVSHNFVYNDKTLSEYKRRTKNNMLDDLQLFEDNVLIFSCALQTVANHPKMYYSDTIAPGPFQLKLFVDQKSFNTEIHGIINTKDITGEVIDKYSKQKTKGQYIGRWLFHSCYYAPLKRDTKAYSGGCIVSSTNHLLSFNTIIKTKGFKKNDIINGYLYEID